MGPPANLGKGNKGFEKGPGKMALEDRALWDHRLPWENEPMSLGVLRDHPCFEALEWHFRVQLQELTTVLWPVIQGGRDQEALELWEDIWTLLELDADSWMDLMILVHQGPVGRSEANMILWKVLTELATTREYRNLSRKVSSLIGASRRVIDRPPGGHAGLSGWSYKKALHPRFPEFLSWRVPDDPQLTMEPSGAPLRPPFCFGPPPAPPAVPQQVPQGGSHEGLKGKGKGGGSWSGEASSSSGPRPRAFQWR
jgi:hypothetical protein